MVPAWASRHPLPREVDGLDDLGVAGAPADVARERLPDLCLGRVRVAAQKVRGGDDQAGCAEAALHRAGFDEGFLRRVQLAVRRESLDGRHLPALRLSGQHKARADERAIEEDGARTTLALLARVLRAVETEPLPQHVQEALAL